MLLFPLAWPNFFALPLSDTGGVSMYAPGCRSPYLEGLSSGIGLGDGKTGCSLVGGVAGWGTSSSDVSLSVMDVLSESALRTMVVWSDWVDVSEGGLLSLSFVEAALDGTEGASDDLPLGMIVSAEPSVALVLVRPRVDEMVSARVGLEAPPGTILRRTCFMGGDGGRESVEASRSTDALDALLPISTGCVLRTERAGGGGGSRGSGRSESALVLKDEVESSVETELLDAVDDDAEWVTEPAVEPLVILSLREGGLPFFLSMDRGSTMDVGVPSGSCWPLSSSAVVSRGRRGGVAARARECQLAGTVHGERAGTVHPRMVAVQSFDDNGRLLSAEEGKDGCEFVLASTGDDWRSSIARVLPAILSTPRKANAHWTGAASYLVAGIRPLSEAEACLGAPCPW